MLVCTFTTDNGTEYGMHVQHHTVHLL